MSLRPTRVHWLTGAALAIGLAGATCAPGDGATAVASKAHPTKTERRAMLRAVPAGQRLCYAQNVWISGLDRHYGVVVTQAACGGSVYLHLWLERDRTTNSAPWRVLRERSGTIDRPAGCTAPRSVPADIRCL